MSIVPFITLTITLALAAFGLTNAAKLGWSECRVRYWKNRAERMTRENIDWQENCEADREDANKWRASRAARLKRDKAAELRQRAPILAMQQRLEAEIKG